MHDVLNFGANELVVIGSVEGTHLEVATRADHPTRMIPAMRLPSPAGAACAAADVSRHTARRRGGGGRAPPITLGKRRCRGAPPLSPLTAVGSPGRHRRGQRPDPTRIAQGGRCRPRRLVARPAPRPTVFAPSPRHAPPSRRRPVRAP